MTDTHDNAETNEMYEALVKFGANFVKYPENFAPTDPEIAEAITALTHWRDKAVVEGQLAILRSTPLTFNGNRRSQGHDDYLDRKIYELQNELRQLTQENSNGK